MTAYAMTWAPALRPSGAEPVPDMVAAYYAGGLGKYLPGGAWQYVGRAGLLVRRGVPVGAASASLVLEALASAAAAGAARAARGRARGPGCGRRRGPGDPRAGAVGALGRLVRRVPGFGALELHRLPGLVARYVLVWLLFGVAFWLTARALFDVPASEVLRYSGVFAAAWVAGFVVVIAPGGLGVREAVIVALLRGRLGEAEAIVLATASRIAFTIVDLGAGVPCAARCPALLARRRSGVRRYAAAVPGLRWNAVVFDLDGTLIDTIELILASHRHAAQRCSAATSRRGAAVGDRHAADRPDARRSTRSAPQDAVRHLPRAGTTRNTTRCCGRSTASRAARRLRRRGRRDRRRDVEVARRRRPGVLASSRRAVCSTPS